MASLVSKRWLFILMLLLLSMAWHARVHAQYASVRINWTDTSDNEDGFKVERLVAGLMDTTVTTGPNITSYTDSGLIAGTIYCYRVWAFNSAGESDPSNQVCGAAQGGGNNGNGTPTTVTVSPTNVAPSGTVTASWSGIVTPTYMDWVGLYAPGSGEMDFADWIYVSCSKNPASTRSSGSCPFVMPRRLAAGEYELRLFANDGYTRLASSGTFAVSRDGSVRNPTLTAAPTNVAPSGTVTASWSGIVTPTYMDWVGLYAPGSGEMDFADWIYVNCSKNPASTRSSGSCPFVMPRRLAAGEYELRLFANDGYTRLASSGAITVSSSSPAVLVSTSTNGNGGGSRPDLASQVRNSSPDSPPTPELPRSSNGDYAARRWSNYHLTVKLQSMDDNAIGIIFRYQDSKNYYRFSWNRERALRRLEKLENGALTVLHEDAIPYVTGQVYNLEIIVQGTTIKAGIDGAPAFSVVDSSFADGTIGLYSAGNQGAIFDDVLVQDLATGAVLLSEGFNDPSFTGWTIVDESTEHGPSAWSSETGALVQSSNIGSNNGDLGTFALYTR